MKIIKTLLNKIDQYIWKRGGLLFRLWFTFEEYGEEDGEPVGYVKRRLFKFK